MPVLIFAEVERLVARFGREQVPPEELLVAVDRYPGSLVGRVPDEVLAQLKPSSLEVVAPLVGTTLSWKPGGIDLLEVLKGGEAARVVGESVAWRLHYQKMDLVRRAFARWCAIRVLPQWRAWREPESVVVDYLRTGDESKREAARDAAGSAARVAWDAAYRAARAAFWAASWDAAWDAASAAARAAASAAYWAASRAAEQDKQRIQLAKMLLEAADGRVEWVWVEKEVQSE